MSRQATKAEPKLLQSNVLAVTIMGGNLSELDATTETQPDWVVVEGPALIAACLCAS